jgi:hypothetical protein
VLNKVQAGSDDLMFDINGDGAVNRADARVMVRLFNNLEGVPCEKVEAVSLVYALSEGSAGSDSGRGIAVDAEGNSVVTGWIGDSFGSLVEVKGGFFVTKYAPDGSHIGKKLSLPK